MNTIDLNADLGESFGAYATGNDAALLGLVSSANVACGFHAGDPLVLLSTMREAAANGVRVGAHPGYRDLAGFGRREMKYSPAELEAEVIYQLGAAQAAARAAGTQLSYVKPHGAMYNTIAVNEDLARAVIRAITQFDSSLSLMALSGAPIVDWARDAGLRVIEEVFADRAYNPDGTLVSRSLPGAVHHDASVVAAQALAFAQNSPITAVDGTALSLNADSICVHGDTPEALEHVESIIALLKANGFEVSA